MSAEFKTYPAISVPVFDVPEPKDINAKFIYNYFLPNERESNNTYHSRESFLRHKRKYARQVDLSFTPLTAIVPDSAELSEIQLSSRQKQRLLKRYKKKITKETEFMGNEFLAVALQDQDATSRILANVEALMQNAAITAANQDNPLEMLLMYASETSDNIDGQKILDSVVASDSNEYVTIDPVTGEPFEIQKTGDMNSLAFNFIMSQKFSADIANAAIKEPLSPALNLFSGALEELTSAQTQARTSSSSRRVKAKDFVRSFRPIQMEKMGLDDVFLGGNTVMGYRIRRYRTDNPDKIKDIFITNAEANSYTDRRVMYGYEYVYTISVIYLVRLFAYRKAGRGRTTVVAADALIESRESPSISVTCKEGVPPEAPDGLEFYLLQNGELILEWDYPFNPKEDIKRFQVFRRKTIDDPFKLICEIDFDDSTVLTERNENVGPYASKKYTVPRTYYCDGEWDLNSKFIYAVCSVDAHDLSSPYSEQFSVGYNMFDAKLEIEMISEKNAPKPYPNFVLRSQLTQDAIRDSNHSSLSCYFDPEYLKVFDAEKEEVDFLQTSRDEVSYKIQLIHLNFQQSVVADINVK